MKALLLWFLAAFTLITASFAVAVTADVSGLVYYADSVFPNPTGFCFPISEATVSLYKRTANDRWQQFGDATTTTSDGYYVFPDISVDDPYGLFENAGWCKIVVDAAGSLPAQWPGPTSLTRYVYKEPRDGAIRVDYIFFDWFHPTPPDLPPSYLLTLNGHAAVNDGNGNARSIPEPDALLMPYPHEATCPIGQNLIYFKSCVGGHWTINGINHENYWGDVDPAYARYEFYEINSSPPPDKTLIGAGYYYWHPDWPWWALHYDGTFVYIAVDFVDMPFPPSREARPAKSGLPAAVKPARASLYPATPNPSRGTASISFELNQPAAVTLNVYDVAGRKVSTLIAGPVAAGTHEVAVTNLTPGVYIYRLETPGYTAAKKMVVTR